jgi:hypothetical protein
VTEQIFRTIGALYICSVYASVYGVLAGAGYGLFLWGTEGQSYRPDLTLYLFFGAFFGAVYGTVTGLVGSTLGGPLGWGIGGFLGSLLPGLIYFPPGQQGFPNFSEGAFVPALIAAAFGATVGFATRLGIPVLPAMRPLTRIVYGSPLGGWLGWRR